MKGFFVYVVESPSALDLYQARFESQLIAQFVRLDGIPCVTRIAIDETAFIAALRLGLPEAMKQFPNCLPILHLSAHGDEDGIQLSNGTNLTWIELRELLIPINESISGSLLLCMSACNGYSACRMAMHEGNDPHPYFVMVGTPGKPTWSDTAVGYSAFYHHISKGNSFDIAINALRAASGEQGWLHESAENSKKGYLEYVANIKPNEVLEHLESVAENEVTSEDMKALERS